jgi:tetratricopeptide (TPR) repeat protein
MSLPWAPYTRKSSRLVPPAKLAFYTVDMMRRCMIVCGACCIALAVCASGFARQSAPASQAPGLEIQTGVVLPHEVCAKQPDQSYALYLPTVYTPTKRWPTIYVFDPLARGNVPLEFMKDAAERYGFIVVGSNNSRNGAWKIEFDAAQAMSDDTHTRLSIDDRRIYFSGFSGGARVASRIARLCKCAAGVMLNGAGFPVGEPPTRDSVFAVFAAVGDLDFNYPEVTRLDQSLDALGFPHALRYFEGPHRWAPEEVMDEAFAWFRIMAMKQGREPRNPDFIAGQKKAAAARAHAFEQAGDSYSAMREYRKSMAAFDGIADISDFQQQAAALAPQKAVREAAKRQAKEIDEQRALVSEISFGLSAVGRTSTNTADVRTDTNRRIVDLRERAAHEKRPDQVRVLQRAVADVFAQAIESGISRIEGEDKDYTTAKDYFQLALAMRPDSAWAFSHLATACALSGDRKGALDALRRAKETTPDPETFASWLQSEPAFEKLRDDQRFRDLLQKH